MSAYEGKTRIYQFNPNFPLLEELKALLKKAYTLASSEEKRSYHVISAGCYGDRQLKTLLDFWHRLGEIKKLSFQAQSKADTGWNGRGQGEVTVSKDHSSTLIFNERGVWRGNNAASVNFKNVFRWTLDRIAGSISLEHLRHGLENPVFLFDLGPSTSNSLVSIDAHLCASDAYFGSLHLNSHSLHLKWRVIGPHKNEEINYRYSA